jgi:hypothetical protein
MMHGHEKSDSVIVAVKPTNKAERSAAELGEPRAGTEGNARQLYGSELPSIPEVRSRMRESRTYGSGRGARGNSRPYREVPTSAIGTNEPRRCPARGSAYRSPAEITRAALGPSAVALSDQGRDRGPCAAGAALKGRVKRKG